MSVVCSGVWNICLSKQTVTSKPGVCLKIVKHIAISAFFLLVTIAPACGMSQFNGRVVKIIDGDSLLVSAANKTIEVRLYGVDCPEYNQPFSKVIKRFVRKNVLAEKVTVSPEYYDSYGRLVAIVAKGSWVLNSKLVSSGYAWVYPQFCRKEVCKSWKIDQKRAEEEQKGIWSKEKQVPPWKWKRMKHHR